MNNGMNRYSLILQLNYRKWFLLTFQSSFESFYFAIVVYTGKESKVYAFDSSSVFLLLKAYITV